MKVVAIDRDIWIKDYQDVAYKAVFGFDPPSEIKNSLFDKAFLVIDEEKDSPIIYATVKQTTEKSLFIEFGGSFPSYKLSPKVRKAFFLLCKTFKEAGSTYTSLSTLNNNISMQKLALSAGFMPMGMNISNHGLMIDYALQSKGEE